MADEQKKVTLPDGREANVVDVQQPQAPEPETLSLPDLNKKLDTYLQQLEDLRSGRSSAFGKMTRANGQSVSGGYFTVQWDGITVAKNVTASTTTYGFKVQQRAWYEIQAMVTLDAPAAASLHRLRIDVNGTGKTNSYNQANTATAGLTVQVLDIMQLSAGDLVTISVEGGTGLNILGNPNNNIFTIIKL